MLIASEPTPPGAGDGPFTNEYVPVLLVGSNAHGPFGAISPLPTTVVLVAAAATSTTVVGNGDIAQNGPWALEPTSNTGTYSFVNGPSPAPGGVGSLAMSIASGNHEWLNNYSSAA